MENLATYKPPDLKIFLEDYRPFLLEVKKRVVRTLVVFTIATVAGFFLYEKIIKLLIALLSLKGINIVFTSPFQFINLAISCGFACGVIASFPLLVFQFVSFLKPALREKEYKIITLLLPFSFILFTLGFLFGGLIMKWQIEIFLDKSVSLGIGNILDISRLLTTVLLTSVLMGVSFQFPIVLLMLLRFGLIKMSSLRRMRPGIYLASFIFSMLLPPDSILADILLTLPLIILFELTLLLNSMFGKKA